MDEFTSIAIWLLIGFVSIGAMITWFQTSPTFVDQNWSGQGFTNPNMVSASDLNSMQIGTNCSTVSGNPLLYAPCFLNQEITPVTTMLGYVWNILTAWVSVLDMVLSPLGSIGELFKAIFIPFFAFVEIVAIIVIGMRIAAIIRGVAGGFL